MFVGGRGVMIRTVLLPWAKGTIPAGLTWWSHTWRARYPPAPPRTRWSKARWWWWRWWRGSSLSSRRWVARTCSSPGESRCHHQRSSSWGRRRWCWAAGRGDREALRRSPWLSVEWTRFELRCVSVYLSYWHLFCVLFRARADFRAASTS